VQSRARKLKTACLAPTVAAAEHPAPAHLAPPILQYQAWMKMGLHIATPNKRFGAGPLPRFQALRALALQTGRHFKYEVCGVRWGGRAPLPLQANARGARRQCCKHTCAEPSLDELKSCWSLAPCRRRWARGSPSLARSAA